MSSSSVAVIGLNLLHCFTGVFRYTWLWWIIISVHFENSYICSYFPLLKFCLHNAILCRNCSAAKIAFKQFVSLCLISLKWKRKTVSAPHCSLVAASKQRQLTWEAIKLSTQSSFCQCQGGRDWLSGAPLFSYNLIKSNGWPLGNALRAAAEGIKQSDQGQHGAHCSAQRAIQITLGNFKWGNLICMKHIACEC